MPAKVARERRTDKNIRERPRTASHDWLPSNVAATDRREACARAQAARRSGERARGRLDLPRKLASSDQLGDGGDILV